MPKIKKGWLLLFYIKEASPTTIMKHRVNNEENILWKGKRMTEGKNNQVHRKEQLVSHNLACLEKCCIWFSVYGSIEEKSLKFCSI